MPARSRRGSTADGPSWNSASPPSPWTKRVVVQRSRAIEQEREVAIYDILEANVFRPEGSGGGPYHLTLGLEENRLVLDIALEDGTAPGTDDCCR